MSDFPAIKPTARSFTPGKLPDSTFRSLSGKETRVVFADTYSGHDLSLTFTGLLEADADVIMQHYVDQQGTVLDFTLPASVWAGWTLYGTLVSSVQRWRYAKLPSVQTIAPGILTVDVKLVGLA